MTIQSCLKIYLKELRLVNFSRFMSKLGFLRVFSETGTCQFCSLMESQVHTNILKKLMGKHLTVGFATFCTSDIPRRVLGKVPYPYSILIHRKLFSAKNALYFYKTLSNVVPSPNIIEPYGENHKVPILLLFHDLLLSKASKLWLHTLPSLIVEGGQLPNSNLFQ